MSSCSDRNIPHYGKEEVKGNSKSTDFMEIIEKIYFLNVNNIFSSPISIRLRNNKHLRVFVTVFN
jgi:hypothetical protein